ncbi:MAG TPA: hypothetical protein VGF97_09485 [Rhizomicrobium sp.]|jgi:hypothetical protein
MALRLHAGRPAGIVLLMALALPVQGCDQNEGGHHGGRGALGMHHLMRPLLHQGLRMGMRGMRPPRFREACADDVRKFCPNAHTRRDERECLQGKRDTLDATCKAALDRRREGNGR